MFGEQEATLISPRHKTPVKAVLVPQFHDMAAYWGSGASGPTHFWPRLQME